MKRACIYLKLTKEDLYDAMRVVQDQKKTIELIENEPDWKYAGSYACTENLDTEFQKLLSDCRRGKIDVIIIKNVDQLGSDPDECMRAASLLQEAAGDGIELISIEEGIFTLGDLIQKIRSMIPGK